MPIAHPTPCSRANCVPSPTSDCRAFHPRVGGNGRGSVRKGGAAPKGNSRGPNNNRSPSIGNMPNHHNRKSGNNGNSHNRSNNTSHLQLIKRVAAVERRMGTTTLGGQRRQGVSYRDAVASSNPPPLTNSSGGGRIVGASSGGGFAHVQPDPAVLSTVVAAVMAVLSGGKQLF